MSGGIFFNYCRSIRLVLEAGKLNNHQKNREISHLT